MKRHIRISAARVACLVLGIAAALPATAGIINLAATIDGAQANAGAGTGSAGTGSATMTYDDVTNVFAWDISWSGLSGPAVAAHFHGPATPNMNAGVQVNFGAISGLTSSSIGSASINVVQAADLLAGLWYINIHTQAHPGGEIRGQVRRVPEPPVIALLLWGIAGLVFVRRRRA